jgi:hypothetical protein
MGLMLFYGVLALGFVACVAIGSIAWYNSERPSGWEDSEAPKWAKQSWAQAKGEQGKTPVQPQAAPAQE